MKPIDCADHAELLATIAKAEGLPVETFEIVGSIKEWCDAHQIADSHPDRIAKCLTEKESGKPLILIKRKLAVHHMRSVLDFMEVSGYGDVAAAIRDEVHFLQVLAYHEIAHLKLAKPTEEQCDRWALKKSNEPRA